MKRIIALFLCLIMIFACAAVQAADPSTPIENVSFSVDRPIAGSQRDPFFMMKTIFKNPMKYYFGKTLMQPEIKLPNLYCSNPE